ncbi:Holliday junction resolvase Hjc [Sulfuracidifex tepidarius]|uniref:Holliday junction resolvase Hje n=1 Tax=Sulfuracidifex tepidarius TaxID=1294262 RepID=A0A510E6L5_9CREN|nr:Holliday junction resolvase Hjc [Sulfuracidifex tepidarius]BBG25387.1 Holliday junction resolvase Hje [Sulfuracidifex tepidarius]BBG28181.1 Holliday junction resolvase Hje [Sulfuracidifex tepidarius]
MNKDIGRNAERELVKTLTSLGFKAVRIPTSNSSPNPLPDVFATFGDTLLAFEVKSTWEPKLKIREIQIRKLLDFLSMFTMEGHAYVAVKFKLFTKWELFEVTEPSSIEVRAGEGKELLSFFHSRSQGTEQLI